MIYLFQFLLFLCINRFIHANDRYHLGIINHQIQWHVHCPQNQTRIIHPPFNDQPLITYQCPHDSLPVDVVPLEVDFTFICRSQSRLIWIIIDLYQYNDWVWSENLEKLNITIELNRKILVNESQSELNKHQNRFILINAFFIPFEKLENLLEQSVQIFIRINRCQFSFAENITWNQVLNEQCHTIQSKTLHAQHAQCDYVPQLIDSFDENTTTLPDYHVVLQIDQNKPIATTTIADHLPDYYLLFNEHLKQILSALTVTLRASHLLMYTFIFTLISLILLILFFLYILCYHYHTRTKRKSLLLI